MSNPNFDTKAFRNALGTFTTGVTIITTKAADGTEVGLTANSFNSVSLDPPLVLWSLAKSAMSVPVFNAAEHWNVHVLSSSQQELSGRFASRGEDKFSGLLQDKGVSSAPLLQGCAARFQCRNAFIHDGGDHIIFIGEVLDFDRNDQAPLAFHSGQYALTVPQPWEEVNLSQADDTLACSYNEDLLGYLLGRSHFQMLSKMRSVLTEHLLQDIHFFALSVLSINDGINIEQLNTHIEYTGRCVSDAQLQHMINSNLLKKTDQYYFLTDQGRQVSLQQIAQAKAIEDELVDGLSQGEINALKLLLKQIIKRTDPGLPDLWSKVS